MTTSEFSLKKLVKGQNDLDYYSAGKTVQGGAVDYALTVTNNQDVNLKNIEMVDILPYVGDKGVILTNQDRGTQFNVYATGAVEAEIINLIGDPVDPNPEITIEYSTSNDPVRFDQLGNVIGTGIWLPLPPDDITTLRSIKITTGANVELKPYERLIVYIKAKAPVGVSLSQIAYNSYAVRANKIMGDTTEPMLPTEPNKVSVQVENTNLGSIGQFVWDDINGDGIWQSNELGVNGIKVELYDSNMQLLKTTVTANNAQGNAGYYLFNNLVAGNYFVKFIPFAPYTLTVQNIVDPNGSRPNQNTGITTQITLAQGQQIVDKNAGVVGRPCTKPIIVAKNKCLYVGEEFDPLENVSAINCRGNDITERIVVVKNTVDTSKEGLYEVEYSVTDFRNQKTTKTIEVLVCKKSPRQQAISDLIQSIALEETAISHIMNAEAEKIKKAKDLDFDGNQMIEINNSVARMTKSVTELSITLKNKLNLFGSGLCKGGCCDRFDKGE